MKKEKVMQTIQRDLAAEIRAGRVKNKSQMDAWLDFYLVHLPTGVDHSAGKLSVLTLKSIPDPMVFKIPSSVSSEKLP
jgi:hypothetical protein